MVKVKTKKNSQKRCHCVTKSHKGYCNVNSQCPHLHFKTDVVRRDELTQNQYLDLLCTPRGYRWEANEGEVEEEDEYEEPKPHRRIICRGRRVRKQKRAYVHNFLAEVWTLLTPEMITRLKEMLQSEFKMSPEEAESFISEQRAKTIIEEAPEPHKHVKGFVVNRGRKCAGIRHYYSNQFNKIISAKLADYLVATLSARRSRNQRQISEFLLKNLCDLTGEKFTLQYPKTLVHKIMVFVTDQVAGWFAERVEEAEVLIKEDREIDEIKAANKKYKKAKERKKDKNMMEGEGIKENPKLESEPSGDELKEDSKVRNMKQSSSKEASQNDIKENLTTESGTDMEETSDKPPSGEPEDL